ncbi:hypothetical protein V7068_19150 [Bacillus sp. JJ634]
MNKKRGLHSVTGSVSPQKLSQTKVYLGNKSRDNHSVQKGSFYKRKKYGDGGCGCGSGNNPKRRNGK